jgi:hypothetical protein
MKINIACTKEHFRCDTVHSGLTYQNIIFSHSLLKFCSSHAILSVVKSRRISWARHTERSGKRKRCSDSRKLILKEETMLHNWA